MDIRKIRCFLCVAKHLSFSRAAEELYLAQSTVSTQVDQLEQELGVLLFIRDKRKVELTAEGKLAMEEYTSLLEKLDLVPGHLKSLSQGQKLLRIGLFANGMTVYENRILQASRLFEQSRPDVRILATTGEWAPLKDQMIANRLDLIFAPASEAADYPMVHVTPLFRDTMCIALPADDPLCGETSIKMSMLSNRCILIPTSHLAPSTFRISHDFMEDVFETPPVFIPCEGSINTLASIRMRHGVGIFPQSFRPVTSLPDICFIDVEEKNLYYTQSILHISEDPLVQQYIRFSKETILQQNEETILTNF